MEFIGVMRFIRAVFLLTFFCGAFAFAAEINRLSVPVFTTAPELKIDGIPDEPFWQKAASINGLSTFKYAGGKRVFYPASADTQCRIAFDRENIYIGLICQEPVGFHPGRIEEASWRNDGAEIFIASKKHRWLRQIGIGLSGSRYYEFIDSRKCKTVIHIDKKHWSAEVVIPVKSLGEFSTDDLRFNILRNRVKAKELQTWGRMTYGQDTDSYGFLHLYTPADEVTHGPWVFSVTGNSAVINWVTAGACPGMLYFRKAGTGKFTVVRSNIDGNIQRGDHDLHPVQLKGLEPDTLYEYHTGDGNIRTFRTLSSKKEDFTFAFTADIHGSCGELEKHLRDPQVQKADLLFLAGDMVTSVTGRECCYEGFLDALAANWQKAAYVLRGNHEYLGGSSGIFCDLVAPFKRTTYGAAYHKGVFFIMLDADIIPDFANEYFDIQKKWFQRICRTPEFKNADYRVLMNHYPLFTSKMGGGSGLLKIFNSVPKEVRDSFDLMLGGHSHSYNRVLPGDKKLYSTNPDRNGMSPVLPVAFPVLTRLPGGIILVEKTGETLKVNILDGSGKVFDRVTVKSKK